MSGDGRAVTWTVEFEEGSAEMSEDESAQVEHDVAYYRCKHLSERQPPHLCPYAEVLGPGGEECTCCESCVAACADDI